MLPAKRFLRKINGGVCILLSRLSQLFSPNPAAESPRSHPHLQLSLLISRPQDVDLLVDIYQRSRQRDNVRVTFWATERAIERFPATLKRLTEYQITPDFILSHARLILAIPILRRSHALLTTVESTLAAHKMPHLLTKMANAAGLQTYTLQHGFENAGLTYTEGIYGPTVRFASKTVFTWGPVNNLPAVISEETRRKCVAVGCPKHHLDTSFESIPDRDGRPIIAVFESLLSNRSDEASNRFDHRYIALFFKDLQEMASRFPALRFILKLHPGAVERSAQINEFLRSLCEVEVVDPAKPEASADWSTPRLLSNALAAITTPSTIALDAALAGAPVAVIRYNQPIHYYSYFEPLPILDETEDWHRFLNCVTENPAFMESILKRFLDNVILPGDAAGRILDVVFDHTRQRKEN